jgi:hypothetical protein
MVADAALDSNRQLELTMQMVWMAAKLARKSASSGKKDGI